MSDTLQQEKFDQMTKDPVEGLICKMAVPSIISMLVSAFYNMADTFFVGQISTQATAAVGIIFSYMALIQAVSFFFGHGSGNFISRALGRQDTLDAKRMAATGFFSAILFGCLIIIPCFFWNDAILRMLGATPTILPEAKKYFLYILVATPFMMGSLVLNNQMRFQGNARLGMIGISTGAVLNILLDPILIFGCHLGISGAALATAISQSVGFFVLLVMSHRSDGVKIRWSAFSPTWKSYKEIIAGGLPSLLRQGLASVAAIYLNQAAGLYGDSAIAAFSIVNRSMMIAASALIGFGQGFQPVCGFNYGAGLYERVRKSFWFSVWVATAVLFALSILGFLFAKPIVRVFRADDAKVIEIGARALTYQSIVFTLQGWVIIVNMFLQTTRKTIRASITAMSRQGIVFIPVLLITSHIFGLNGICLTQPISDVLTFLLSIPLGLSGLREMKEEEKN
ncbi:MAG: MATE family efflux transporter [Velocimicrobium sp.]